jgi:hypothetical protein
MDKYGLDFVRGEFKFLQRTSPDAVMKIRKLAQSYST